MADWTFPPGFKPYDYHFWDEPYLKSAGPNFAGVFVAFHPFIRLQPANGELFWKPPEGLIDAASPDLSRRDVLAYEKANASEVLWSTVVKEVGLEGPQDIDRFYASFWQRLKPEFMRHDLVGTVGDWCKSTNTYMPEEDWIPPTFEQRLAFLARRAGVNRLASGHVWHGGWRDFSVDLLEDPTTSAFAAGYVDVVLFAPRHEFVAITLIDNCYTLFAVTPEVMSAVDIPSIFEGFWATEKTCEEWKNDPIAFGGGPVTTPAWAVIDGKVSYPGLASVG